MKTESRRVLLYGDVDLRYTDGSAIWLTSMARALVATDSDVTLLLKSRMGEGGLFDDLSEIDGLTIIDDFADGFAKGPRYSALDAARRIESLVTAHEIDVVVCRGFALCREVARQPEAGKRLWAYMTDIPQTSSAMTDDAVAALSEVAIRARRIFAQTEEARDFLEFHVPAARVKTLLLPPMLPDALKSVADDTAASGPVAGQKARRAGPLRLVYAGKFAKDWRTLEMCELPRRAAEAGLNVEVTMIGDKFQSDPDDPAWAARMRERIQTAPGIIWLGAMSRTDSLREIQRHDAGLAWRTPTLDSSHEISTKLLEYLACGTPPIVNRTVMHENLLGSEFPFFVDHDVVETLQRAAWAEAHPIDFQQRLRATVEPFWVSKRAQYLERELRRASTEAGAPEPLRIHVAGGPAFRESITTTFGSAQNVSVAGIATQTGQTLDNGEQATMAIANSLAAARTAFPNSAVWLSTDDPDNDPRPTGLDLAGVLIRDSRLRQAASRWAGVEPAQVFVLPPPLDPTARRPKHRDARFHLAAIIEPGDEAAAVAQCHTILERLVARDLRFTLRILLPAAASTTGWERELMLDALEDLALDPAVRSSWSLAHATGSASWLRTVGWITGSRPESVRKLLGLTPALSGTVELASLLGDPGTSSNATDGDNATAASEAESLAVEHWQELSAAASRETVSTDGSELARLLLAAGI